MDSLRGLSSVTVLVVHAIQVFVLPYYGMGTPIQVYTSLAATYALMVFFVVSGFMIALSVQRHRLKNGAFDSFGFLYARLIRIYPPFLLSLIVTIVVYLLIVMLGMHGAESFRLPGDVWIAREKVVLEWNLIPSTLLLVYNVFPGINGPITLNGPLWTLSYEFWLYLWTMFATNALTNRQIVYGWVPMFMIAGVVLWSRNQLYIVFCLVWFGGYALGYMYRSGWLFKRSFPSRARRVAALSVAALLAIGNVDLETLVLNPLISLQGLLVLWMICTVLTVGLAFKVRSLQRKKEIVRDGFACRAAKYSYTLYLIHYPILLFGFSLSHPLTHGGSPAVSALSALPAIIVAIVAAKFLAKFVEDKARVKKFLLRFGSLRKSQPVGR